LSTGQSDAPARPEDDHYLAVAPLQEAIDSLPAEKRRVLALHYFDDVDQRHAAELLYMSERTFRRRLRRTLGDLRRMLGVPAPEPNSHRGLEVGLAAWTSLGGARAAVSSGAPEHATGILESLLQAPGRLLGRSPGARLMASDAPERIGAIGAGPAGKVLGGCAGAAAVCVLSGIVGPGVDLGGGSNPGHPHRDGPVASAHHAESGRPFLVEPRADPSAHWKAETAPTSESSPSSRQSPSRRASGKPSGKKTESEPERRPSEAEEVEEQFSGVARAAAEAEAESSSPPTESTAAEQTAPAESTPPAESAQTSSEERQVEKQFRGPLAP
jgi:hypothetical protein